MSRQKVAFFGLPDSHKLSRAELIQSIRFLMATQFESIEMCSRLADNTEDTEAQQYLRDAVQKTNAQVDQFLDLLGKLDPKSRDFYKRGVEEARTTT